jgi:hypothetical protein
MIDDQIKKFVFDSSVNVTHVTNSPNSKAPHPGVCRVLASAIKEQRDTFCPAPPPAHSTHVCVV